MRSGFSLVEILVALVVLQIGLLATSALALEGLRTLRRAEVTERTGWMVRSVADSLLPLDTVDPGEREIDGLRIRWRPAGGRAVEVEVRSSDTTDPARFLVPLMGGASR